MGNIQKLRKLLGYTQEQFADLLGVSDSTVTMWETMQREPDYGTLQKISQLFNIPKGFITGIGVFEKWDQIIKYYNDICHELMKLIPLRLEMPFFLEIKI